MPRNSNYTLIAGTRGSDLALAQTRSVIDMILNQNKGLQISTKIIKTFGDGLKMNRHPQVTGKNSFTREIDIALKKGEVDFAVHSLKDVPIEDLAGSVKELEIAAYPKRESPYDVLISNIPHASIQGIPEGARVGTSSLRRAIQIKLWRPDLEIVEIHGNVSTRIKKLREKKSNLDALILAEAGLNRLGIQSNVDEVIPSDIILPAIGQGCLAVSVRSCDNKTKKIVSKIDHKKTRLCVVAERSFSKELGGGCNTPIAALGRINKSTLRLCGLIVGETKSEGRKSNFVIRDEITGHPKEGESLGKRLAQKLKAMPA